MQNSIETSTTERPLNYITIMFRLHFIQNYFKTEECLFFYHFLSTLWAHNLNFPRVHLSYSRDLLIIHTTHMIAAQRAQIKKTREDKKKMLTEITGLLHSNQAPCLSPGFNQYVINRVLFPVHPFMHQLPLLRNPSWPGVA